MAGETIKKDSIVPKEPRKGIGDSVKQIKNLVGGQLGEALAEGLLLLEKQSVEVEDSVSRLNDSLGTMRVKIATATDTAKSAEQKADTAQKGATEARTLAESANNDLVKVINYVDGMSSTADQALESANKAQERVDGISVRFNEVEVGTAGALEKVEAQLAEKLDGFGGRISGNTARLEDVEKAVRNFGGEVEDARRVAVQASKDADKALDVSQHAEEQIRTVEEIAKEVCAKHGQAEEYTNRMVADVKQEVEAVRTSLSPPPPAMNGRPTPKSGATEDDAETEILAEMAKRREDRSAAQEALKLVKELQSSLSNFRWQVRLAFNEVDKKLKLLGFAGGASDEEMDVLEKSSFKYAPKAPKSEDTG